MPCRAKKSPEISSAAHALKVALKEMIPTDKKGLGRESRSKEKLLKAAQASCQSKKAAWKRGEKERKTLDVL